MTTTTLSPIYAATLASRKSKDREIAELRQKVELLEKRIKWLEELHDEVVDAIEGINPSAVRVRLSF